MSVGVAGVGDPPLALRSFSRINRGPEPAVHARKEWLKSSVRYRLDHDAFARTFLGRFEGVFDQMVGDSGQATGAFGPMPGTVLAVKKDGFAEMLCLFFDDPQAVATLGEDVRGDLLANPVTGTKILIDPNPQFCGCCHGVGITDNAAGAN